MTYSIHDTRPLTEREDDLRALDAIQAILEDSISDFALEDAENLYDEDITPRVLAERISMYVHAFTQYGSVRPFGATVLLASVCPKTGTPSLFTIEPAGTVTKNFGVAVGKGRQLARSAIEKLNLKELPPRDALYNAARILLKGQDKDTEKERQNDFEYLWISKETQGIPVHVPMELVREIEEEAKRAIQIEEEA